MVFEVRYYRRMLWINWMDRDDRVTNVEVQTTVEPR